MYYIWKYHILIISLGLEAAKSSAKQKNVLFLVVDDLRPQLGSYAGHDFPGLKEKMFTPNIDRLGKQSAIFKRAYVQQALCLPSRISFLTSRRPDTTHAYSQEHMYWRTHVGNFTTLPQYFKENDYMSIGMGKIFHPGTSAGHHDPISWSLPFYWPTGETNKKGPPRWKAIPEHVIKKKPLCDMLLKDTAISSLKMLSYNFKKTGQNFFLAVGFFRPHSPLNCPEKYFSHYPLDSISHPNNYFEPYGMPPVARGRQQNYSSLETMNLRRAYYACISYIDSLIGEILNTLHDENIEQSTIVSVIGDHGYQLGEHSFWQKHTNFELATHAPFILKVPGVTDKGIEIRHLVEFVDIFPTLVDVAGFPSLPVCPLDSSDSLVCTEGSSLLPLMKNPNQDIWKTAAFSQYDRKLQPEEIIMGYTMKTDRYRYTEWVLFNQKTYQPIWNVNHGIELYDHVEDPEENFNIAGFPSYANLLNTLSAMLHGGWRQAMP